MKTSCRGLRVLTRCAAGLLLVSQAGCLFERLYTTAREPQAAEARAAAKAAPGSMVVTGSGQAPAELIQTSAATIQEPNATSPSAGQGKKVPEKDSTAGLLPVPSPLPTVKITFADGELTLPDLIHLAVQSQPSLVIAQAKVQGARGQMIQAGLYPNPTLSLDWDTLGARGSPAGDPGALIAQEFVTAHKLKIARAAAEAGVQAADWDAMTRLFEVMTLVRRAYVDLLAARREEKTSRDIAKVAQDNLDAANKLFKGGLGTRPDVLRAETELERARVLEAKASLRAQAAIVLLAAAVGVPTLPAPVVGDLDQPVPLYGWQGLLEQVLSQSSEVQAAQSRVLQMEGRLTREQVERIPNILTEFRPFYSTGERNAQIEVIVGAKVPLFNRNQGNILSAQANLVQARAEVNQVELSLTQRLADSYRRYQLARQEVDAFRTRIVPKARESFELMQKGYEAGEKQYTFTALLQVQQTLFQAQLSQVAALDELWRAVADIEGLLQRKCE